MSDLVSKVLAGGLSGALFLFWWPSAVPGDGAEWLVVRGLLWALAFEVLLLAFCPLERAVTAAVRARRVQGLTVGRGARALVLAFAGLAVPCMLLNGTEARPDPARAAAPKQRVIVEREIVRREVVVKRVNKVVPVTVAAKPTPVTAAPAASAARGSSSAKEARRSKAVAKRTLVVDKPTSKKNTTAKSTPAATTPSAPAATKAAPASGTGQNAGASPAPAPAATSTATAPVVSPAG